jgi:hypothetical protein
MRIIGRSMFNGGFLWQKEPRMMRSNNYWWANGSVIMQTQNNGLRSVLSHFFLARSNTIVNSIISINATHASKAKANFDVVNNNSYAL